MTPLSCPGSRLMRQPRPEEVECPACGEDVEIWSDEVRARCPACGCMVHRGGTQGCLEWCAQAALCVGAETYARYQRNRGLLTRPTDRGTTETNNKTNPGGNPCVSP